VKNWDEGDFGSDPAHATGRAGRLSRLIPINAAELAERRLEPIGLASKPVSTEGRLCLDE
jgi:hypothetical protein